MKMQCDNCQFFKSNEDGSGECRRYAPRPRLGTEDSGKLFHSWPAVLHNDYCGEWHARYPLNVAKGA